MAEPDETHDRDDEHEEEEDGPFLRIEELAARVGLPDFDWAGLLAAAIVHASDPARVDIPGLVALPWIPRGPRNLGGRIRAMAQDPREPATIYAGSGLGGMWKTLNGGDTWMPLDDFRPPNQPNAVRQALPIGAIAIAPGNRQTLYVGTGEPSLPLDNNGNIIDVRMSGLGLYRSTDAGATFEMIDRVSPGPEGSPPSVIGARRFERIAVDPWEPRRIWVASPKGLWRGEPSGSAAAPPVFTQDVVTGTGAPVAAAQDASDVVIDFGGRSTARDFDPTAEVPPAQFTVYVALRTVGIFRRTFDRATAAYTGAWTKLDRGIDETNFNRIKLALCATRPNFLYAVFALSDNTSSRVYRSEDRGDRWHKTSARADEDNGQAYYNLVIETHPENPAIVFTGSVDLFRSLSGGESWEKVMDWRQFNLGDHAQHGDQHAFIFDGLDRRTVWVGNDGGISMSRDLGKPGTWRKRSHGILTAQFNDITVHPVYPFIMGGGLQDMGTWVSFGGETWYSLFGGDGGQMSFDPTTPQQFFLSTQKRISSRNITSTTADTTGNSFVTPLPDVPPAPMPPAVTPVTKLQSQSPATPAGFAAAHKPTFVGIIEQHPVIANHALVGRRQAAYLTRDGVNFVQLNTGAFNLADDEVSALAYAPGSPDNDWWCGTLGGEVFHTTTGTIAPATPIASIVWTRILLPGIVLPVAGTSRRSRVRISNITVHPRNPSIVAVAVSMPGTPGRVYLTGDGGTTWQEISGRTAPLNSHAAEQLSPSPILSVVFDPHGPAAVAAPQTLYAGTLAGVYVIRNASPPVVAAPAPPAPVWGTFNNGLPLVMIQDLTTVVERDAGLNITRAALCCATLGRGIYECDLAGTPAARLFIRKTPIDTGRTYLGAANLTNDPRQSPMPTLTPFNQAFDIRVDCPPFSFVEEVMDGAEFDEGLSNDQPAAGERNLVYVQVHTGGTDTLVNVQVSLFFADAAAAPAGAAWQPIDPPQSVTVGPAQPAVARFEWTPPANVPNPVALLAICTHPSDPIPALPPALVVDPANPAAPFLAEPRAALRVVPVTPFVGDVYVRDGIDDDGSPGSVAWGARSPDIIVLQTPEANPDATFNDLSDRRTGDKIKGGATNHIYVRVHNRRGVPLSADVDLYHVPFATMEQNGTWVQIGATVTVNDIPPKGWKFTAAIPFASPPDPDTSPSHPYKVYLLVAIVRRADDPMPNRATITTLNLFWQFFLRQSISNNTAMRALRFEP